MRLLTKTTATIVYSEDGQTRMQSDLSSLVSRLAEKDRLIEEMRKMSWPCVAPRHSDARAIWAFSRDNVATLPQTIALGQ